ncbi:hypothetical protein Q5752_004663 [Cryptotrichosporon argae]
MALPDLFLGIVFYCDHSAVHHAAWSHTINILRSLGAIGSSRIGAHNLTHIIVFPADTKAHAIYPEYSDRRLPSDQADHLDFVDIVHRFGHSTAARPPKMPYVVNARWIDACITAHRVLGQDDRWGGWLIRRSRDPRHVNASYSAAETSPERPSLDESWHRKSNKSLPPRPLVAEETPPVPAVTQTLQQLKRPGMPATTLLDRIDLEPPFLHDQPAPSTPPLRIRGTSASRSKSREPQRERDAAKRLREPDSPVKSGGGVKPELVSPGPPRKRSRSRSPTRETDLATPSVTASFLDIESERSLPSMQPILATSVPTVPPATVPAQALSSVGIFAIDSFLSIWFAVEGPAFFRTGTERLIKSNCGHLAPRTRAQVFVLPLERGDGHDLRNACIDTIVLHGGRLSLDIRNRNLTHMLVSYYEPRRWRVVATDPGHWRGPSSTHAHGVHDVVQYYATDVRDVGFDDAPSGGAPVLVDAEQSSDAKLITPLRVPLPYGPRGSPHSPDRTDGGSARKASRPDYAAGTGARARHVSTTTSCAPTTPSTRVTVRDALDPAPRPTSTEQSELCEKKRGSKTRDSEHASGKTRESKDTDGKALDRQDHPHDKGKPAKRAKPVTIPFINDGPLDPEKTKADASASVSPDSISLDHLAADTDAEPTPGLAAHAVTPVATPLSEDALRQRTPAAAVFRPVFAVNDLVGLWICVEGDHISRDSIKIHITHNGGLIRPRWSAQVVVVPVKAGHPKELEDKQDPTSGLVVTYEWILASLEAGRTSDMMAFLVAPYVGYPGCSDVSIVP